ncbi:MAG TPA: DUF732 domain-containing protein [Mycobacterium sp.]|nr:DUF732 domain-containing protein [Mycobacterium sp.]
MDTSTPNPPSVPGIALVAAVLFGFAVIAGVVVFYRRPDLLAPRTGRTGTHTVAVQDGPGAEPLDQDGRLFYLLTEQGLQTSGARDVTMNEAHHVCERVHAGETEAQIVRDIMAGSPGMSAQTAATFTEIAVNVYCPQG